MVAKGRQRLPRFVLFTWFDGKKMWLQSIDRRAVGVVTYHTPNYWEGLLLTKYKADNLATDLRSADREYEVEPA